MLNDFKICIVVVGYNRPDAIMRLLSSLERAHYGNDKVDLIISIDKGERQSEIVEKTLYFEWKHGEKQIRAFNERQGLRKHIIQCGDVVEQYDAVIVLEDDITVSNGFYNYAKQNAIFYQNEEKIAGISLYKHQTNVNVVRFFEPEYNGYDVFAMQFAQSWGECWTKKMWHKFKEWYIKNEKSVFTVPDREKLRNIPKKIIQWGDQSWMKFFMAYIVENDLYFVYPYHSLTTNHSEIGQHNVAVCGDYQVALASGLQKYRLPKFEDIVKYDIFFERIDYSIVGYENKKTVLDLYGGREYFGSPEIIISSQQLPYRVIETWKLKYHPHELNCKFPESGKGIYVYDAMHHSKKPKDDNRILRTRYDVRATNWRQLMALAQSSFLASVRRKLKL